MSSKVPPHAIYLKWGKCEVKAVGIPAVLTVLIVVATLSRLWGVW